MTASGSHTGISWDKADGLLNHRTLDVPGVGIESGTRSSETTDEIIRRLSHSSEGSDLHAGSTSMADEIDPMSAYSLEARILQKKDQLEELSATGLVIPTPIVEEVRTGQQFLIKLHLCKKESSHTSKFPSIRVGRREAINTAGESRADPEPLTLEIAVRLAKSGSYGPSSPILVLLDQLSPSATDPATYAHIDTTTGSITMLAKVICSSTDHGERGNKDRYIFEFRLKRTNTMSTRQSIVCSPSPSVDTVEDDGETISTCFTHPIMCSGHHKAKRAYPHQKPSKVTKAGPTPKTKIIKRHKSAPNITLQPQDGYPSEEQSNRLNSAGSMANNPGFPPPMAYLPDHLSQLPLLETYSERSNSGDLCTGHADINSSSFMTSAQAPSGMMHQSSSQYPRITEVRPDHGPIRKRTDVVLRGLFFREGMIPYFGVFPAQDVVMETSSLIICKVPESSMPGTVPIAIYDGMNNSYSDLGQFTYTDDGETELLILQLQLRLAHRALEYLHAQATGQKGHADDILRNIPGLTASSNSGSVMMRNMLDFNLAINPDTPILSLSQVEEGILDTLDHIPKEIDISLQLEDGSNMLHLAILLGFSRVAARLIEDGCDLEAHDVYGMTPLMYAVFQGNEIIVRLLVIAGASSSGAKTPEEFYAYMPRQVEATQNMLRFLSVSCTRFSNVRAISAMSTAEEEVGLDRVLEGSEECAGIDALDSSSFVGSASPSTLSPTCNILSVEVESADVVLDTTTSGNSGDEISRLESTIQGVRANHDIPPLDQQDLPPMQIIETDGSVTINNKVLKGAELPDTGEPGTELYTNVNPESGYHSGVYSEVQERLNRLHLTALPSEGIQMEVLFKKLRPTDPAPASVRPLPISSRPLELFRTGDSFAIEIRIVTLPGEGQLPMPKEYLGIRFPHELVKRVSGRPASILTDMTYILNTTIEFGKSSDDVGGALSSFSSSSQETSSNISSHRDSIPLIGSCQACSKFLHEQRKLSPSRRSTFDPSVYPILQFSIPGGASSSHTSGVQAATPGSVSSSAMSSSKTNNSGVVELRDGMCEVKAKVNCSSLHHLIQRERTARTAQRRQQHEQQLQSEQATSGGSVAMATSTPSPSTSSASSSYPSTESSPSVASKSLAVGDLCDPGYVFKFELVHPTLKQVVARYQTNPIMFQSYSRGRS
ncbi:SPT3 Dosage dependent suppressor of Ty-induced promoter mutations-like protein [Mortierella claussenii]|nr:SPT3 Dosage dependent suppressor of Ty-induced promoter mutations-like protein [Mortierella claussenii]